MRPTPRALVLVLPLLLDCGPSLAPPDVGGASLTDDAAASAPLTGDDGGSDDGASTVDAGDDGSSAPVADAGVPLAPADAASDSPADATPDGACAQPPGPGDLVIDELMIESVAGTGDYGEWLEIESTLPCTVDLRGLHGECADGARIRTFDVSDDVWLGPGGTLVVADSLDPTLDHDVPGLVLAWSGHPGDVLRNAGGTVTLRVGDGVVDTVTWPKYTLAVGTSLELPADCPVASRTDFSRWQPATASWFPGFRGTPNAPNVDVRCP